PRPPPRPPLFPYTTLFRSPGQVLGVRLARQPGQKLVLLIQDRETGDYLSDGVAPLEHDPSISQRANNLESFLTRLLLACSFAVADRKSTRLNSSHLVISYA